MTGMSVASLTGVSSVSATSTKRTQSDFSLPADPNTPEFAANGTKGFAKGTHGKPITQATIKQIHETLMKNKGRSSGIIPNFNAEPDASEERGSEKRIVGYGVDWSGSSPDILVKHSPVGLPDPAKRDIKTNAHADIENFIGNGGGK